MDQRNTRSMSKKMMSIEFKTVFLLLSLVVAIRASCFSSGVRGGGPIGKDCRHGETKKENCYTDCTCYNGYWSCSGCTPPYPTGFDDSCELLFDEVECKWNIVKKRPSGTCVARGAIG